MYKVRSHSCQFVQARVGRHHLDCCFEAIGATPGFLHCFDVFRFSDGRAETIRRAKCSDESVKVDGGVLSGEVKVVPKAVFDEDMAVFMKPVQCFLEAFKVIGVDDIFANNVTEFGKGTNGPYHIFWYMTLNSGKVDLNKSSALVVQLSVATDLH